MNQPSWIGYNLGERYQIEERIGQGGMSTVYKATDPNLRRTVAVKLIHPHLSNNTEFVRRFREEAAAVAQLNHPNIIQVFDFNNENDTFYMILEYLLGESLQERLVRLNADGRQMPVPDVVDIIASISDALDYAHKRGMVHRDIKPANIMLTTEGVAKLMDFGVVKLIGSKQHTATGAVIGTAIYMSPEQARGEHPDTRADIYSLGVTLFEMTSGRPPFQADSAMTTMMMHVNDPVPDIMEFNPNTPPELKAVIEKALEKSPDDRYPTAAAMAADLRNILNGGDAPIGATFIEDAGTAVSAEPAPDSTFLEDAMDTPAPDGIFMEELAIETAPEGTFVEDPMADQSPQGTFVEEPLVPAAQAPPSPAALTKPASSTDMKEAGAPPAQSTPAAKSSGRGLPIALIIGGIGALVVLAGIVIGAIVFLGGRSDDGGVSAAEAEETNAAEAVLAAAPTQTPEPTEAPTEPPLPTETPTLAQTATPTVPPGIPFVRINDITLSESTYVVAYETFEYEPVLPGMHIHFFFNTVSIDNAGAPGAGPWFLYSGPEPFTGYTINDRPADATQLCALVANPDHSIQRDSGNCVDLP